MQAVMAEHFDCAAPASFNSTVYPPPWKYLATAPRPAAWRSVYLAGIVELFHRPAVINAGNSTPVAVRFAAVPM